MRFQLHPLLYILLILWCLPWPMHGTVMGQTGKGLVVDSETGFVIPFVKIQSDTSVIFSAYDGEFFYRPGTAIYLTHPLYESRSVAIPFSDTITVIKLRYSPPEGNDSTMARGRRIFQEFQKHSEETNPENLKAYEVLTTYKLAIYKRPRHDKEAGWTKIRSMESLEKNRYKYRDKYFHKILRSRFSDGDSSDVEHIPINAYSLSPYQEFIKIGQLDYLNPLHVTAKKKYDYNEVETFYYKNVRYHILFVRPKTRKHFLGLRGLYYITEDDYGVAAFVLITQPLKSEYAQCVVTNQFTEKNVWINEYIYLEAILEREPRYSEDMKLVMRSTNSGVNFNIDDQSSNKWLNMILLGKKKTKFSDESWSMEGLTLKNSENLSYIEKDTVKGGFVRKDWTSWVYDIYMGRLAYRLPYIYIRNILSINRYEYLRLGVGVQTHKQFSDIFTTGGYFGYGFKDKEFKYGANIGFFLGRKRSTQITYAISKDVREPGRTEYIKQEKNYLRNFFSKHMDNIRGQYIRFKAFPNRKVDLGVSLNNFNLETTYPYTFVPLAESGQDTTRMHFTELLFQVRFGSGQPFNKNIRKLFYPNKNIFSNLFINLAKGFKNAMNSDFSYWKINARLFIFIDFVSKGKLDIMLESGVMTPDQPYQINYIAPGNDVELAGITIRNAFQTMGLYKYVSDRYLNGFFQYDFGSIFFKNTKFDPHLAVALNMGWGLFTGDPSLHRGVITRDYGTGYYEAGILLNNLLKAKIYKYIYGGLGIGVYYSLKTPDSDPNWALRLTYTLGAL